METPPLKTSELIPKQQNPKAHNLLDHYHYLEQQFSEGVSEVIILKKVYDDAISIHENNPSEETDAEQLKARTKWYSANKRNLLIKFEISSVMIQLRIEYGISL